MTPSEKFVSELCNLSFLPFWSFTSPLGKKDKELCDVFVVCENIIIIISVKDIKISDHPDETVQYKRWQSKAIEGSIDQIYGAEKFLSRVDKVVLKDQITQIPLPEKKNREIYRIAIAFGGENRFPLETGNFGKGFVHVFDENSTFTVLRELDTVRDFVDYLKAKEVFLKGKRISVPKEVDFLALYLSDGLEFDHGPDNIVLDDGLWDDYILSEEYKKWQIEIKQSYIWDNIVSSLYTLHIKDKVHGELISSLEKATRMIALEPRINRIELGMLLEQAINLKLKGRMIKPLPGSTHCYVFMPLSSKNWEDKEKELEMRCWVARYENQEATKIIGISIGKDVEDEQTFDIVYLDIPELTDEQIKYIQSIKSDLGYFKNPVISHSKDLR